MEGAHSPKETISFRIDRERRRALDKLAAHSSRNRSELISDAIAAFIEVQSWQLAEIERGIVEAEAGLFASDREVATTIRKLTK